MTETTTSSFSGTPESISALKMPVTSCTGFTGQSSTCQEKEKCAMVGKS